VLTNSSHCVRSGLIKYLLNLPIQLFHHLELFTFELRFQITK
jgi:hypothetical protein